MDLGLKDRPALVAAASKGLGRACAEVLAEEGARVAICARDARALEATRDRIAEATGSTVVAVPADVSTEAGATGFVRESVEALGGCEILVPNVGGPRPGTFDELGDGDFQAAFDLLFLSATRMAREALPHMRATGYGRVVLIGSSAVKQPIPGLMLSNAIRTGLIGWARTLVDEVGPDGITVNAVLPGRHATDRIRELHEDRARREGIAVEDAAAEDASQIPLRRIGDPRELAHVVAFLASERASYVSGAFVQVDGGMYRGLL